MSELMYALFPHVARTLESLRARVRDISTKLTILQDAVIEATDAVIRLLGTRRTHRYAEYFVAWCFDQFTCIRS